MQPVRKYELNSEIKAQIIRKGKKGFSEEMSAASAKEATTEQSHKRSQFILNELGYLWPSIEDIKKSVRNEWTIPSVKNRITELKKEHRQQFTKAVKYQEDEHAQMMVDDYYAFDTMADWGADFTGEVKSFLRMEDHLQKHQSDNFISSLRYSQILALKPLYKKLQQLLIQEEMAKQQRARRFPKSSQAWREMDTRDAKLKVAKFLLMDKKKQEEMLLREADWRVDRADIGRMVLELSTNVVFAVEIKAFVRDSQTTDPRRRG